MDYARVKCTDVDGRLRDVDVRFRAELDGKFPKSLAALETNLARTTLPSLMTKSKEHTDGIVKDLETKTTSASRSWSPS